MYQLSDSSMILRLVDNAWIPNDSANRDWVEYQAWLAAGNYPLDVNGNSTAPADQPEEGGE